MNNLIQIDLKSRKLLEELQRCEILSTLGTGSQKQVFLARLLGGNQIALKIGRYRSPNSLQRIKREAKFLAEVDSPGLASILEFHSDEGTREFLFFETYAEGRTLDKCAALMQNNPKQVINLATSCFGILTPVWAKKIVHRDLKPQNIILNRKYSPTILDFGIARFLDETSLTASHSGRGPCTPMYAAREQLTNRKVSIDHRSDFFSLGVMCLELLTGVHPFCPETVGGGDDLIENIISGEYFISSENRSIHRELVEFLEKCIQREPHMRFRNATTAIDALHSLNQ